MRRFCILALMIGALNTMAQVHDFEKGWTFWSDSNPSNKSIVSLPHDAMQTERRSADAPDGRHNGFFPGGKYHYEKTIEIPTEWLSKHITINFEGIYQKSSVYINNHLAGGCIYGYTPFSICADGMLKEGTNLLRVDVDNSQVANSRWYSGAGIYRAVHLKEQEQTYIKDVKIHTQSVSPAIVNISTSVEMPSDSGMIYKVCNKLLWNGKLVAYGEGTNINLSVPDAKLWSADVPNLYQIVVELQKNGRTIDVVDKRFGIREISWSSQGFYINGQQTLLRGGCLHHDNGILGACEYDDAAIRRIATLKRYGFNAIRASHNPCSEAVLRACDSLGMYVMDELWDTWYLQKTPFDYSHDWEANHQQDMEAMVNKDFNHPSVIMYSIGNEVKEPVDERGLETARSLVQKLHQLDPSRPVTAGINLTILFLQKRGLLEQQMAAGNQREDISSEQYNKMVASLGDKMMKVVQLPVVDTITAPVFNLMDIAGYNYGNYRYEADSVTHPGRIIVGTETFMTNLYENWEKVKRLPYLIGDFMWTAWDYIGEVSLGAWYNTDDSPSFTNQYPCLLAGSGALDLLGHPTGEALRAKAVWMADKKPYIAVRPVSRQQLVKASWRGTNSIPSWSWDGMEGEKTTVEVFTRCKTVCLYLNGQFIGSQAVKNCVSTFEVAYQSGVLKAIAIDENGQQHEAELCSAQKPLRISINPEPGSYHVGKLIFVDIDLTDALGIVESNRDSQLSVQVDGATLLGYGSAQPRTEECFTDGRYTTYYGRSQAVILADKPGRVTITVKGKGLKTAKRVITVS